VSARSYTRHAPRHRPALVVATASAAFVALVSSVALALAYAVERRRRDADRLHVLRTLTHELRTPVTSLRLDIEPLRSSYDSLPMTCQAPLLRISDGIERLHAVLHRTARYMTLFDENTPRAASLVKLRDVPSTREMFEAFAEEWPEGVSLSSAPADGPIRTDPDWLSVAVRNLAENGARHGRPPVVVEWKLTSTELVVRVVDGGSTPKLERKRARPSTAAGLGLGLALVARIARLLDGRLVHEPSPTAFELRVPVRR
jgi:two-component system osmolarity sensor histidine kinase EnvZ